MLTGADDTGTIIETDVAVLYSGKDNVDKRNFIVSDNDTKYYSYSGKAFNIEAKNSLKGIWVVKNENSVVDTISGNVLVEGCTDCSFADGDGFVIIIATTEDGVKDLYVAS